MSNESSLSIYIFPPLPTSLVQEWINTKKLGICSPYLGCVYLLYLLKHWLQLPSMTCKSSPNSWMDFSSQFPQGWRYPCCLRSFSAAFFPYNELSIDMLWNTITFIVAYPSCGGFLVTVWRATFKQMSESLGFMLLSNFLTMNYPDGWAFFFLFLCCIELKGISIKDNTVNGGNGMGKSRWKMAAHDVPPGRPCCCWRRKETTFGTVSLVTEE